MSIESRQLFYIDETEAGKRIDSVLAGKLEDVSRSFIQKLFDENAIFVNDEICGIKKYKVKAGDCIGVELPEPKELKVEAENIPIDIVYEDDDLLVVNKERGMVVHPAPGNYTGTLVNALMYHCGDRLSSINGVIRPGIVHRIDKDTSGLLVVAKNDKAHESLSAQLAEHSITRKYQALVNNNFANDEGTVDKPIGRDPKNRFKRAVTSVGSKRAVTHYRVLKRYGRYTLIEAQLETGRTHQIRVHMAYIKHPLVGDPLYGPSNGKFRADGQLLHAKVLGFMHPTSGEYMEFDSELPQYFTKILKGLE